MAAKLASTIRAVNNNAIQLAWEVEANEIFVVMQRKIAENLKETGRVSPFYEWNVPDRERGSVRVGIRGDWFIFIFLALD
jgi:threonine aldolase